jgi:hypothetical protein
VCRRFRATVSIRARIPVASSKALSLGGRGSRGRDRDARINGGVMLVRALEREGTHEIFTLHGGHLDARLCGPQQLPALVPELPRLMRVKR